jgi:hypothetical protein
MLPVLCAMAWWLRPGALAMPTAMRTRDPVPPPPHRPSAPQCECECLAPAYRTDLRGNSPALIWESLADAGWLVHYHSHRRTICKAIPKSLTA